MNDKQRQKKKTAIKGYEDRGQVKLSETHDFACAECSGLPQLHACKTCGKRNCPSNDKHHYARSGCPSCLGA